MVRIALGGGGVRILFIAADPLEYSGLLPRLVGVAPVTLGADWARGGRLGTHDVLLVANGAGRSRAAAALEAACAVFAADAVVNTGFCGALDPSLEVAAVVAGTAIAGEGGEFPVRPVAANALYRQGVVYTADRVAQTAAEKAELRRTGAAVVEMEAAGVAAESLRRGLPLYCVRAVTDLADESFANDFNAALREDGHFDTMIILRNSVRRPLARLPELIRLRNRCALAARTLGDFFADCRF